MTQNKTSAISRISAYIGIALFFLVTAGFCSSYLMKTAYNWADTYFYGKIHDMFDLEKDQKTKVKQDIRSIIAWHRKIGLPEIESDLRAFQKKLQNKLVYEDIQWLEQKTDAVFSQIAKKVLPRAIDFLATLSKEQILFFKEKFEENLRDLQKKLEESWQDRQDKEFKKLYSRLEGIYGNFSEAQKLAILAYFKQIPDYLKEDIDNKKKKHSEFHFFMLGRPTKQAIARKFTPWVLNWKDHLGTPLRRKLEQATKARFEMFYQVDRLLTKEQRQHGIEKIQEYINIVSELQKP